MLSARSWSFNPSYALAVYAEDGRRRFLGLPVRPLDGVCDGGDDRIVVAAFDQPDRHGGALTGRDVDPERLIFLVRREP